MTTGPIRVVTTLLAALALALGMGMAAAVAAPDRDDGARAASALAFGGLGSDICGTTGPVHLDCPFCTLAEPPRHAAPNLRIRKLPRILTPRLADDLHRATTSRRLGDPARAPPSLS